MPFLCLASFLVVGLAGTYAAEPTSVPDPSTMLPLVPAAAQAGAPPCIKPGTRLTYFGMTASIPGEYKQLVQDDKGRWVDKRTGQHYSEHDIPGASGAGYNVVSVGAIGGGLVQLSTKLYTLDTTTRKCLFSVGGGMVGHAGCAADYWIHPEVLKQVQETNAGGVRILRMPYPVQGKVYQAIRFQSEDARSYNAWVYDLETGLLIYHGSRAQGKPILTPPIGDTGRPGIGQGSTQLVTGWLAEVRDIDVPWKDAAPPEWIKTFGRLSYSGLQRTMAAGTNLDRPMTITITPKARGDAWVRFGSYGVIQSYPGMPPEEARTEGACGGATICGLWVPPAGLTSLRRGQVIESHALVGTTVSVSNVGPGFVTFTETGPLHRIDFTYDTRSGMMSALTLAQQIGLARITHMMQLSGQQ